MATKLRDLIRNVRACKTASEERKIIAKECADIRTAFKSKDDDLRHRHVAKLLYIHMLGYPTHFGQIEAIKLIASNRFGEKRIGYLALMLLLDENEQLLMMSTNSMQKDLANTRSPFVAGLALCAIGNICSSDIASDLLRDVGAFLSNPNPYLRKKAALCCIRIVRKVPEAVETYIDIAPELLKDRNHAVQLTGIQLMLEMTRIAPEIIPQYRELVPRLLSLLKSLWLAGYMSEYDVMGIADPFLQCAILRFLRVLGKGDAKTSEMMNEILASVVINTETSKVPGTAIVYECVQTIMGIESEGGLRVLAINVLGKFLLSKDNNFRYVALKALCQIAVHDTEAVQRHRNTIVNCIKDADISIRRRVVHLIYALVTKNNIKGLVKELLNYLALTSSGDDFKIDLIAKICLVVNRYSPSRAWYVYTLASILKIEAVFANDNITIDIITMLSRNKDLQAYGVYQLFTFINDEIALQRQALLQCALWCIGEYGDYLTSPDATASANAHIQDVDEENITPFVTLTPYDILNLLRVIMVSKTTNEITHQYLLTCLLKLNHRFLAFGNDIVPIINNLLTFYTHNRHIELQQRCAEYNVLLGIDNELKSKILTRMPQYAKISNETYVPITELPSNQEEKTIPSDLTVQNTQQQQNAGTNTLVGTQSTSSDINILDDLLGNLNITQNTSTNTATTSAPAATAASSSSNSAMDIFSMLDGTPAPQPTQPTQPAVAASNDKIYPSRVIYSNPDVSVSAVVHESVPGTYTIHVTFSNQTMFPLSNFDFQIATPTYIEKQLQPASSKVLPPNNSEIVTQTFHLKNTLYGTKQTALKARVIYTCNGANKVEQTPPISIPQ